MIRAVLALCLLPQTAIADTCADSFKALLAAPPRNGEPHVAVVAVRHDTDRAIWRESLQSETYYMTKSIEPAGDADMLVHSGREFTLGADGLWTVTATFDAAEYSATRAETRAARAANVIAASCGFERYDGRDLRLVAGRVAELDAAEGPMEFRFLLEPESGAVLREEMKTIDAEVYFRQTVDYLGPLTEPLPVPPS